MSGGTGSGVSKAAQQKARASAHTKHTRTCKCGKTLTGNGWRTHARSCTAYLLRYGWEFNKTEQATLMAQFREHEPDPHKRVRMLRAAQFNEAVQRGLIFHDDIPWEYRNTALVPTKDRIALLQDVDDGVVRYIPAQNTVVNLAYGTQRQVVAETAELRQAGWVTVEITDDNDVLGGYPYTLTGEGRKVLNNRHAPALVAAGFDPPPAVDQVWHHHNTTGLPDGQRRLVRITSIWKVEAGWSCRVAAGHQDRDGHITWRSEHGDDGVVFLDHLVAEYRLVTS